MAVLSVLRTTMRSASPAGAPFSMYAERRASFTLCSDSGRSSATCSASSLTLAPNQPVTVRAATPGPGVLALALADQTLYVGGSFTTLGGRITSECRCGGRARRESHSDVGAQPDGTVYALLATLRDRLRRRRIFDNAGGQARSRIAALDPHTGQRNDWDPSATGGAVYALARDSRRRLRRRLVRRDRRHRAQAPRRARREHRQGDVVQPERLRNLRLRARARGAAGRRRRLRRWADHEDPGHAVRYAAAFDRATSDTTAWESGRKLRPRARPGR